MKKYEGDMDKAKEGLRNLLGYEANILLDSTGSPIEQIGAQVDRFMDLLGFVRKYIDVSEYEDVPIEVMDKREQIRERQ